MNPNDRRWTDATRGVYEVWYATWNHPGTDQGFWLRYITEAPVVPKMERGGLAPPRGEDPRAELWFARFDPHRPDRTFGIHKQFPIAQLASRTDPFSVTIAGSELGNDYAFGELSGAGHEVRWDLHWQPSSHVLRQLPDAMYARGGISETVVHSPNPRVPLSGTLIVDGEELELDRAIAGQTHVWGKKHAYSWTWGRCGEFAGAPDAVLELIGVRLQRRGMMLPPLTVINLELDGERHQLNQLRHVVRNRSTWRGSRVEFSAWSPTVKLEGELVCTPDQMVSAPYLDPDGTKVFCANTEIGDARVTLWKRSGLAWREHRRLEGKRRAHFELGARERDPAVIREHVLVE